MKVRRYSFGLIFKGFQRIVADEMGTTEELSEQLRRRRPKADVRGKDGLAERRSRGARKHCRRCRNLARIARCPNYRRAVDLELTKTRASPNDGCPGSSASAET
jgi:hypothetical protein